MGVVDDEALPCEPEQIGGRAMSVTRRAAFVALVGTAAAAVPATPASAHTATAFPRGGAAYGYAEVIGGHRTAVACASNQGGTLTGWFFLNNGDEFVLADAPGGDCATRDVPTIGSFYACSAKGCGGFVVA
jgi:hypothetical protein